MTTKNNNQLNITSESELNFDSYFNTLVKLPGVPYDDKAIVEFLDTYFNAQTTVVVEATTRIVSFKVNMLIIRRSKAGIAQVLCTLDKSIYDYAEVLRVLKRVSTNEEDLKNCLILFSVYTINNYPSYNFLSCTEKFHFNPFVISDGGLTSTNYTYSRHNEILIDDKTGSSNKESNFIISFTGNPNFDFDAILNPSKKNLNLSFFQNQYGVAKYIFGSPLLRTMFRYSSPENIGKFIETYIKSKFFKSNFEFVLIKQETFETPFFSKGCHKLKNGIYITNLSGYKLVQNGELFKSAKDRVTFFNPTPATNTNNRGLPVTVSASESFSAQEPKPNSVLGDLTDLKNRKSLFVKILPVFRNMVTGLLLKDLKRTDDKIIVKASKVLFHRTSNSINVTDPYICTIKDAKTGLSYVEVLSPEKFNEYVILIPNETHSDLFYEYSALLNQIYDKEKKNSLIKIENEITDIHSYLTECDEHVGILRLLAKNYVIEYMKICGFKRYNVSLRSLVLLVIHHLYYYNESCKGTLYSIGDSNMFVIMSKLTECFEQESSKKEKAKKITVKMSDLTAVPYSITD